MADKKACRAVNCSLRDMPVTTDKTTCGAELKPDLRSLLDDLLGPYK